MSKVVFAEQIFAEATINKTSAVVETSSVHYNAKDPRRDITRLDSIYQVFPKMVLGEANRHRGHSCSDRSSRAVPPEKLIAEIRSGVGLAMPAAFYRRAKGMGRGEEMTGDELKDAQYRWIDDALYAADEAERAMNANEEKETVNRRLDSYIYIHTLRTGVRDIWLNYFGLRLDSGASKTIILAAEKAFQAYKSATPTPLKPGEWHTPFIDDDDYLEVEKACSPGSPAHLQTQVINLSAARSAHLSFSDLATGKRMTVERGLIIASNLRHSRPLHASPFEHQATPDKSGHPMTSDMWHTPEEHGNFPGWRQYRKMIPGERVASLPEGYEL